MKHIVGSILSALAVLLTGCPSVSQAPGRLATREIANGIVEHAASGMQFPPACGGFTRAGIRQYDANGLDVGAAYNLTSSNTLIAITVYVYPSPTVLSLGSLRSVVDEARSLLGRVEFQRCKNEITQAHGGAQPTNESDIPASATGLARAGYFARFTYTEDFAGRTAPVESLLYVYCYVGNIWTIKYRITYPVGFDARPFVNRFLQELRSTVKEAKQPQEPRTPGGGS